MAREGVYIIQLCSEKSIGLYQGHLQSKVGFHDVSTFRETPDSETRWEQVSPVLVGRRTVSTRASGGATERYDLLGYIVGCTRNSMESPCKTTRVRTEDDVLLQVGRGLGRASTLASDEAKAMMETKAAVEMAYMIK